MDGLCRSTRRLIGIGAVLAAFLAPPACSGLASGDEQAPVANTVAGESSTARPTPIAEILSRPAEDRNRSASVMARGVVTLADPDLFFFAIQDGSAGIYVKAMHLAADAELVGRRRSLHLGQEVEVTGVLDRGGFAPVIVLEEMRTGDDEPLPEPLRPDPSRLFHGADNCRRVELTGVVQGFRDEGLHWGLAAEVAARRMLVRISKRHLPDDPSRLVDATIRMTGVVAAIRNTRGDFLSPSLWIAQPDDLEILEAAPAEPFETPQVPLDAIGRYRLEPVAGHRLQTEGIVTCALPGRFFYLQQGLNGLRVQTPSDASFVPGDRLRVAGFLDMSRQSASIVEALVKKIGHEDPPQPHRIEPDELVRLNTEARQAGVIADPSNFDGCLVTFPAKLVEVDELKPGKVQLILSRGASTVPAVFEGLDISPFMRLQPGSELEVTGVMQIHLQGTEAMASFAADPVIQQLGLQLRSAADVRVLAIPSWWTPQRLAALLAGVLALLAGMLAWVWLMRRELAAQSSLLVSEMRTRRDAAVEFQATLRERNRMAATLHDTLLQTLTGIRFQLGACLSRGRSVSDEAAEHLAVARKMVDLAAQELRESVWGLRTMPMEGQSFMDSLAAMVKHLGRGHAEHLSCRATGSPFIVPNFVAGNLLLCAQEAVNNALKHADAKSIMVTVDFAPALGRIDLSVRDDGSGFSPGAEVGPEQGHFGLTGMRERIERLGGTFTLDTAPGRGTTVRAQVHKRDYDSQIDPSEGRQGLPAAGATTPA